MKWSGTATEPLARPVATLAPHTRPMVHHHSTPHTLCLLTAHEPASHSGVEQCKLPFTGEALASGLEDFDPQSAAINSCCCHGESPSDVHASPPPPPCNRLLTHTHGVPLLHSCLRLPLGCSLGQASWSWCSASRWGCAVPASAWLARLKRQSESCLTTH